MHMLYIHYDTIYIIYRLSKINIAKLRSLQGMETMTFGGHFQAYIAKHIGNVYSVSPGSEGSTLTWDKEWKSLTSS